MSTGLSPTHRGLRRELRRRYWFGCKGYWSSQAKDALPPGVITGDSTADSYNCLVSSQEGQMMRRRGIAYYIETDPTAQVGLLESVTKNLTMNMMCRHMLDVQYPSTAPGTIVGPTALYTDTLDTGHYGQLYVLTSTQGTRKVLGHEMGNLTTPGTTHYPRSAGGTKPNFRMVPLPYIDTNGNVAYGRCTYPLQRALMCGGSMKMHQVGDDVFLPTLHGMPSKWNRKCNPSTTTGSEEVRIRPWGHITPLCRLAVTTTASSGTNDKVWWDGDQFYLSVVYQFEDGSFSAPMQTRPSAFGLITVGSGSGNSAYASLTVTGIPLGPPGTAARIICRTRKTNVSTAVTRPAGMTSPGATSDIDAAGRKLYVVGKIGNNNQSTFVMTGSNDDASLRDDPTVIDDFYIWPLPARYVFEMEHRVGIGYTRKAGIGGILIAPVATDESLSGLNCDDDGRQAGTQLGSTTGTGAGQPYGDVAWCFRFERSLTAVYTLYLRKATIGTGTIVTTSFVVSATMTIQDVIDQVNAIAAVSGATWTAQPVPGTDPNIGARNLAITCVFSSGTASVGTPSVTGVSTGHMVVGMRVNDYGGGSGIPANSVITSISGTTITIGDENGAPVNTTGAIVGVRAWSDTGDDSWSTDTATWDRGNIRTYSAAFPALLALNGFFTRLTPFDKQRIMFTSARAGLSKLASESFYNKPENFVSASSDAGTFMGSARIEQGNIAFYSEGIFALKNKRDMNTGEDQDYYLYRLTAKDEGCIQYGSIVQGRGWAGCLIRNGFLVTDGINHQIISDALLDPAHGGKGLLAYQSITLAANQGVADLPASQTVHAYVVDGTLRLSFGPNANGGPGVAAAQYARPEPTSNGANWAGSDGTPAGNDISPLIDEVTADPADYARIADNFGSAVDVLLTTVADPGVNTAHTVRIMCSKTAQINPASDRFNVGFRVTNTTIASFTTGTGLSTTPTVFEYTLSGAEVATLRATGLNYADLRCHIDTSSSTSAGNNDFRLHWVEFQAASLPAGTISDFGERVICVYDFSKNIEGFGLDQIVGPPGGFPWSSPLGNNTGAMVRTWDGKLYAANDDNTGSTANGTIYQLETGLYDVPVKVYGLATHLSTIAGSLVASTGVITATTATDFRRVAVGAKITGSGITGTATVTAKASTGDTITVSGTLGDATGTYTCWGREIEARAYMVADRCDLLGAEQVSGQWLTPSYACPTGELVKMLHSRDYARATQRTIELAATGAADPVTHRAPMSRTKKDLPSAARTSGPLQEFGFLIYNGSVGTDTSARAEIWGAEAIYRILYSNV
jgi:hypothetical protein